MQQVRSSKLQRGQPCNCDWLTAVCKDQMKMTWSNRRRWTTHCLMLLKGAWEDHFIDGVPPKNSGLLNLVSDAFDFQPDAAVKVSFSLPAECALLVTGSPLFVLLFNLSAGLVQGSVAEEDNSIDTATNARSGKSTREKFL